MRIVQKRQIRGDETQWRQVNGCGGGGGVDDKMF